MEAGNANDFSNMNNEQSCNHCQVYWIESQQEHRVFNYDEGSEGVKWIHGCRCADSQWKNTDGNVEKRRFQRKSKSPVRPEQGKNRIYGSNVGNLFRIRKPLAEQ